MSSREAVVDESRAGGGEEILSPGRGGAGAGAEDVLSYHRGIGRSVVPISVP